MQKRDVPRRGAGRLLRQAALPDLTETRFSTIEKPMLMARAGSAAVGAEATLFCRPDSGLRDGGRHFRELNQVANDKGNQR